jgi:hypothetical protein
MACVRARVVELTSKYQQKGFFRSVWINTFTG